MTRQLDHNLIQRALELLEKGKTIPEILAVIPDDSGELSDILESVREMRDFSNRINKPSQEILERIMHHLPDESIAEQVASRTAVKSNFLNELSVLMHRLKFVVPVALLVFVVFAGTFKSTTVENAPLQGIDTHVQTYSITEPNNDSVNMMMVTPVDNEAPAMRMMKTEMQNTPAQEPFEAPASSFALPSTPSSDNVEEEAASTSTTTATSTPLIIDESVE